MQQTEMFGVYMAHKYAVGCRLPSVAIGIDKDAVRFQTAHLKAGTSCSAQLRLLRRIFWLRACACGCLSGTSQRSWVGRYSGTVCELQ